MTVGLDGISRQGRLCWRFTPLGSVLLDSPQRDHISSTLSGHTASVHQQMAFYVANSC